MKTLAGRQQQFLDYLLTGAGAIKKSVLGTKQVSAERRLGIYGNAYRSRLLESLETDYPGLKALVGDKGFGRLGADYVHRHPSGYFNIRWYGDRLAEFLRSTAPYRDAPALAEMAEFEWAVGLAFDAPDEPVVSVEEMSAIPPASWPNMVLRLQRAIQRLSLIWDVPALWKTAKAGGEPGTPRDAEQALEWLVWRKEYSVFSRPLPADEAWALDAAINGANFANICAGLCRRVEPANAALQAAGMLKQWVGDGLICEILSASSRGKRGP